MSKVYSTVKLSSEGDIEFWDEGATYPHYDISADRLDEEDWVLHMIGKVFCDMNEFIPIYLKACAMQGMRLAPVLTDYKFDNK